MKLIFLFGLLLTFPMWAGAVDILVNKNVSLSSITPQALRAIASLRTTTWPDGGRIQLFVLDENHPAHVSLCKDVLHVHPYQLDQVWVRAVYTGTGVLPTKVESESEMIALVAATPFAIGYVLQRWPKNKRVRVLALD